MPCISIFLNRLSSSWGFRIHGWGRIAHGVRLGSSWLSFVLAAVSPSFSRAVELELLQCLGGLT